MILPDTHSLAGIAATLGLIGLCAAYPQSFTPMAFAGAATMILGGMAGTTAAKAYQLSKTPVAAPASTIPNGDSP